MEFFAAAPALPAEEIRRRITIAALPRCCGLIDQVLRDDGETGEVYCLWGAFAVRRELIRGGVRFTLPECPNALAWTVTAEEGGGSSATVIHCTINRAEHDPDFIESIESFVAAWEEGVVGLVADQPEEAVMPMV
ncbi:hypothetical protein [Endothiovibrio diazotrophicus]